MVAIRSRIQLVVAVLLVATGCTFGDDKTTPAADTADTTTTATTAETSATTSIPTTSVPPTAELTATDVELLLDELPVEVATESFAQWQFSDDDSGSAEIRFVGDVPPEMVAVVAGSPWFDVITLTGGEQIALADLQDVVAEGLDDLGVEQGAGYYDEEARRHTADIAFGPDVPKPSAAQVLADLNDVIVAAGVRPLLDHEVDIEVFDYVENPSREPPTADS